MLYAIYIELYEVIALCILIFLITIFSLLFFIFTFIKVSMTNSVIFLFKLELKQFYLSKILPMWKIGVYIVLIITI